MMSMDMEKRIELVKRNTIEVVTEEELRSIFSEKDEPRAYIGFEPSGLMHLGQFICINKVKELQMAGVKVTVLLADWHAFINDKLGSDFSNIEVGAKYLMDVFKASGVDTERINFRWASELVDGKKYWETLLRVCKFSSLSRMRRALDIMGREMHEIDIDFSKYIYPAMQVTDIFELEVDMALGGMDQRKAHMLARDVAEKLKLKKPIGLHTPLLSSLKSASKMDYTTKMSKSKPEESILLHDKDFELSQKIKKAFCPAGEVEGNPVLDLCRYIIFPLKGELFIKRKVEHGGDLTIRSYQELVNLYSAEKLHPADLKKGVRDAVNSILQPIRDYFKAHPHNYERLKMIVKRLKT